MKNVAEEAAADVVKAAAVDEAAVQKKGKPSKKRRQKPAVVETLVAEVSDEAEDECTTMEEVMKCTKILNDQRAMVQECIERCGPGAAMFAQLARLNMEMESVKTNANKIISRTRAAASSKSV